MVEKKRQREWPWWRESEREREGARENDATWGWLNSIGATNRLVEEQW